MEYKNIMFGVEDSVAVVTLNRPEVLNALNEETMKELGSAMSECKQDGTVRVVILTGVGDKAFIAGADINEFVGKSPAMIMDFAELGHNVVRIMETMGKPIVAAVNGYALGGGLEISMACDMRFASDKARFGQPEILLGLIPGMGGTQRLSRLVGIGLARELIMSGEQVTAQRAYEIGLVNRVFPAEQLMEGTKKFAQRLAGLPPFALRMAKYAINYGYDLALENANSLELQCFSQCWSPEDLKEGVGAFLAKRTPSFTGK